MLPKSITISNVFSPNLNHKASIQLSDGTGLFFTRRGHELHNEGYSETYVFQRKKHSKCFISLYDIELFCTSSWTSSIYLITLWTQNKGKVCKTLISIFSTYDSYLLMEFFIFIVNKCQLYIEKVWNVLRKNGVVPV